MDYLDFDIEIREGDGHVYLVAARSLVGEGQTSAAFPFTDDLSGFHDALMVFNPIVGTTQSASTQPNASHLVTGTLADGIYVSTLKRAMTSIGTENRNKVFRAGKSCDNVISFMLYGINHYQYFCTSSSSQGQKPRHPTTAPGGTKTH